MNPVEALERAILDRAERLAKVYRERAERNRDRILRDAADQIRLRETQELQLAKDRAERDYRRRVQSSELQMQSVMDHMRWDLVEKVRGRLAERMTALIQDEATYLPLLSAYLRHAAGLMDPPHLLVEVNAADHRRLLPQWDTFAKEAAPDKTVTLSGDPLATLGGMRIYSDDRRIRVDHTFEGRMERLKTPIHRIIVERLIPSTVDGGALFKG
ncbi:MAG: V-type ATP synthase subunit E family protein [Pseudomonadota bacterium]